MPSRNAIKQYETGGIYHVYNRGIEKRDIFQDKYDYGFFLSLLKKYLISESKDGRSLANRNQCFEEKVHLLAFCLMPNHYHLLLRQEGKDEMSRFMKAIGNNYSQYFNKKYERVGPLFQGRYKAVLVNDDQYLLHLSRYIHLNPREKGTVPFSLLSDYNYSSYQDYLYLKNTKWIKKDLILDIFYGKNRNHVSNSFIYKDFTENQKEAAELILGKLCIDN